MTGAALGKVQAADVCKICTAAILRYAQHCFADATHSIVLLRSLLARLYPNFCICVSANRVTIRIAALLCALNGAVHPHVVVVQNLCLCDECATNADAYHQHCDKCDRQKLFHNRFPFCV